MIKIFADGAGLGSFARFATDERISGFTTNPSLALGAGVKDYRAFAQEALRLAGTKSVSLEVIADDFTEMGRQARKIASWGPRAVVKIPVMNTRGQPSAGLIKHLSADGVPLNVTAVFTKDQVRVVAEALAGGKGPAIVSVFAGRISDAGVDPLDHLSRCKYILQSLCPRAELLWASTRQSYDVTLAERAKCDIITMTPDQIAKLGIRGKDLLEYSRETVQQFYSDAKEARFEI